MKIAYVTDSGTGKSISELAEDGILSVPLQISDENGNVYQDMETLKTNDMIRLLNEGHAFHTSQPAYGIIEECFSSLKKENVDLIVAVPICNGLSGTISTMTAVAQSLGINIICVDTYVTAVVQEYTIKRIRQLYDEGRSDLEIKLIVDRIINNTNTLVIPKNLDQLLRGGRITPMAAKLGSFLKISPVLQINKRTGGVNDTLQKVRTFRKALERGIAQLEQDHVTDGDDWDIEIAHVSNIEDATNLYHVLSERFPKADIHVINLCNPVAAHVGLGGICIQYFRKL
jgi:DegV family protein with EDD domain